MNITNEISLACQQIADIYRKKLILSKSSGSLSRFSTHISVDDQQFKLVFDLPNHWYNVEYGRKPKDKRDKPGYPPPVAAIEEWIRVKPIVPDNRSGKIPTTRQLVFMLRNHIEKHGIKPKHYLEKSIYSRQADKLVNIIKKELAAQISKSILEAL